MPQAPSPPESAASFNPVLTWMDLTVRAGGSVAEFWRHTIDDWSEVLARTTSMVLRPIDAASLGTTQIGSGFPQHPEGRTIDQLAVGDSASLTRRLSQGDIDAFARISGDDNPAHVDEAWAAQSSLKGRVAHGLLTAGLVSAVLGTELPGPGAIYMSQTLRWLAPVRPGDILTATVTVKEIIAEKGRVVLDTVVSRGEDVVLVGEALVMPRRDR
jgi:3-hydroxybutyryl-CoA dehydratase